MPAAQGIDAMRCSMVVDGAVNGDLFEAFVERVLVPELREGKVVMSVSGGGRVRDLAGCRAAP